MLDVELVVVYHLVPTSNHNRQCFVANDTIVVYHLVPTSNHNLQKVKVPSFQLFIILFLHQTTTLSARSDRLRKLFIILFLHQTTTRNEPDQIFARCLSSCSYIKPQQYKGLLNKCRSCLSSCSYIKPQPQAIQAASNARCLSSCSYIKPQQVKYCFYLQHSCLSSCSYIKPQLPMIIYIVRTVVYHLVPTSNHNSTLVPNLANQLFIILFLHQTTTKRIASLTNLGCLSSCSYIKPQHHNQKRRHAEVVYHLVPTSNHNCPPSWWAHNFVVYHLVPTSNHNMFRLLFSKLLVVYHLVPTSNHNHASV